MNPGLHLALERVEAATDRAARLAADPVSTVRGWKTLHDAELAGLVASCLALGGAGVARDKSREVFRRLGPSLAASADRPVSELIAALDGWVHRFYRGPQLARLLTGARAVQRSRGSLGQRFGELLRAGEALEPALEGWVGEIQRAGWGDEPLDAASKHLLPVPTRGGSSSKRLMLYLRWMVRPDDGVDLGLWSAWVSPAALVIPVDVHILRLSRNLGLTTERAASWRAARQITAELARLRPADPVSFDFALCHLGMLQGCPSRRDERACEGCGVRPVCQHWSGAASGRGAKRLQGG